MSASVRSRLFKVVIGMLTVFSMVFITGCIGLDESDYEMLNGVWDRGDIVVTIHNKDGVFTQINSNGGWLPLLNNGTIRIGDKKFKNITKSGNLKWTCQNLAYPTNNSTTWHSNVTITMDASGHTMQTNDPNSSPSISIYTKVDY